MATSQEDPRIMYIGKHQTAYQFIFGRGSGSAPRIGVEKPSGFFDIYRPLIDGP